MTTWSRCNAAKTHTSYSSVSKIGICTAILAKIILHKKETIFKLVKINQSRNSHCCSLNLLGENSFSFIYFLEGIGFFWVYLGWFISLICIFFIWVYLSSFVYLVIICVLFSLSILSLFDKKNNNVSKENQFFGTRTDTDSWKKH